jgi:peptide deformylase
MSKVEILTLPTESLRQKSKEVDKITPEVQALVKNLVDTLRTVPGYGLAAPQIGKNLRVAVIESKEYRDDEGNITSDAIPLHVLINPRIIKASKEKCEMDEGCFSYPNYYGPVTRPKQVRVKALNADGKEVQINAGGMLARVLQHEIDHLDGILFVDRVKDLSKIRKVEYNDEDKEL